MKSAFLLLVGIILVLSISQVRYDLSDESSIHVNVKNSGKSRLNDVKVTATILDSNDQTSSDKFDIKRHSSVAHVLSWDDPVYDEDSYIKVTITDKDQRMTRYYPADLVMI